MTDWEENSSMIEDVGQNEKTSMLESFILFEVLQVKKDGCECGQTAERDPGSSTGLRPSSLGTGRCVYHWGEPLLATMLLMMNGLYGSMWRCFRMRILIS